MTLRTPQLLRNMRWTQPADIKAEVQRLWDQGEVLASLVTGKPLFPKRMTLKRPTSTELAEQFDDVRAWIIELQAMPHIRLEMREFRHRVHGTNAVPFEIWIDSLCSCLALIGRLREAARFEALIEESRLRESAIVVWLCKRPLQALSLADVWGRLLGIVAWCRSHPRSGVYLREVDIPGVHSKFIDQHRGVLAELLDLALPTEMIDPSASGAAQFARRYGFREKPQRIRFRVLDPTLVLLAENPAQDITLDAMSFAALELPVSRVFITENEINMLAFPPCKNAIVIFGAGYGFEMLREASWLRRCRLYYWGDIDTHGFAMLDQFRSQLPHAESFLMDRETLMEFESQWGIEDKQTLRDLPRLTAEEIALYDDLRDNRIRPNLRLEQERIGFARVEAALRIRALNSRTVAPSRALSACKPHQY